METRCGKTVLQKQRLTLRATSHSSDFNAHAYAYINARLSCDDGASYYLNSGNVLYNAPDLAANGLMEFNGGPEIYTRNNLFIHGGWTLCSPPDSVGSHGDVFVDAQRGWVGICGNVCPSFWYVALVC